MALDRTELDPATIEQTLGILLKNQEDIHAVRGERISELLNRARAAMSSLLHNLLHFGRLLHALGLDVHAGRMLDVARALEHVDIGRRSDFYFTLQSLLIHRQQDLATFDEAFRVFWRRPPGEWSTSDLRALGEQRRFGTPQVDMPAGDSVAPDDPSLATLAEPVDRVEAMSYGAHEVSRVKDFSSSSLTKSFGARRR